MPDVARLLRQARKEASLSQHELAERAGTSQSAVARLEGGRGTVTVATLERLVAAAGFDLSLGIVPRQAQDPVTAAYKLDVDRTLLRENLGRSIDERLRSGAELVDATRELRHATSAARRGRDRS